MEMVLDSEFYMFVLIEMFLIGLFLVLQYSTRFNARFFAGTVLDRRIVDRRMMDRRIGDRRTDYRPGMDRRNEDRRRSSRRDSDL